MRESKNEKFASGIFWELYKDLERQFENFLEYVPYLEGNENIYSFKLLNLILSIGGHIDSAFKEMARYPEFLDNEICQKILKILEESEENIMKGRPPKTVSMKLCLRGFEKEYKLSERKNIFKRLPEREEVTPFKPYNPETKAPEWWEIYNGLKHDVGIYIKKANLQNTRNALASAFLLNVIHIPGVLRLHECDVLKEVGEIPDWQLKDKIKKKEKFVGFVTTPIFIYDFYQ